MKRLTLATGIPFRLPSEAEWEYACRAGSSTVFPDGGNLAPDQANYLYDESGETIGPGALTPRGVYPPNAFGLRDMLGNVCEWTADVWHPDFHGAPTDGSPRFDGETPDRRVIRGGAWDHLPRVLRASWRDWAPESARWDNLGFRIAFTL
jgi:formylglycine-generating enzyme required for sulfatase activity